MLPSIVEARVDDVIQFPDSHYPGLGHRGHLDNGYDFSKECLIALKIL